MNYYEHHLGDYAEATAHLSFVEDAAYIYRAERPTKAVRVRVVFDPLWAWRVWLAMWGIR